MDCALDNLQQQRNTLHNWGLLVANAMSFLVVGVTLMTMVIMGVVVVVEVFLMKCQPPALQG